MNMKRKSPITVDRIRFYTYDCDQTDELVFINQFPYDDRRDFLVDRFFCGVAVKLEFSKDLYGGGVRRKVSLSFIDVATQMEVLTQNVTVNIRKNESVKDLYANFPAGITELKPGRLYNLTIRDCSSSLILAEKGLRLFDKDELPHPSEWYEICDGGIRPAWENELYKTLQPIEDHDYYVRFNLIGRLGSRLPEMLPELELRLFYPDGEYIVVYFKDPRISVKDSNKGNRLFVEYPFSTFRDDTGIFYAELLCMEYPIAGFTFDTNVRDEPGRWSGEYIEPLDEYSENAAIDRWISSPVRSDFPSSFPDVDDFDVLLNRFISGELSKSSTDPETGESGSEIEETCHD